MNLNKKIAYLESLLDYFEKEISYLNEILIKYGFNEGIITLKESLEEFLK